MHEKLMLMSILTKCKIVQAATLLLILNTFAGQKEEEASLAKIDSRVQLLLSDALEMKSAIYSQQLQIDVEDFILTYSIIKLMSGDVTYAYACIEYVRNKYGELLAGGDSAHPLANQTVKTSRSSLHGKSKNAVSPAPARESTIANKTEFGVEPSGARRDWTSPGLQISYHAANALHSILRGNKTQTVTLLSNVCDAAKLQALKKSWDGGKDNIGLGLGLMALALGALLWSVKGGASDPKCDPLLVKKAARDFKNLRGFCAGNKHGMHLWGGATSCGLIMLLVDAAITGLDTSKDKSAIGSVIAMKLKVVNTQHEGDDGRSFALLRAICDTIIAGTKFSDVGQPAEANKAIFAGAGMDFLHRELTQ
jgi:hypothetical protein